MTVTIIAAITRDFALGHQGDLLYHISEDLRRFKTLTMGHPIIMGRKTFESFPKGALPGRRNIVITRTPGYSAPGIETAPSVEDAIAMCEGAEQVFVIGGGQIYRQALPLADRLELTLIDSECPEADTRFPHLNINIPPQGSPLYDHTDPKSQVRYLFMTLDGIS